MKTTVSIGKNAENYAVAYLIANGYTILHTNYRYGKGEIDIVASIKETLVFVEVKFRKNNTFGYPESFVTEAQQRRIISTAEAYIFDENWQGQIRFDIISIEGTSKVTHFEDAFH